MGSRKTDEHTLGVLEHVDSFGVSLQAAGRDTYYADWRGARPPCRMRRIESMGLPRGSFLPSHRTFFFQFAREKLSYGRWH